MTGNQRITEKAVREAVERLRQKGGLSPLREDRGEPLEDAQEDPALDRKQAVRAGRFLIR